MADDQRVCVLQVSTILGAVIAEARRQAEWTEGVAIWIAVAVVSLVGEPSCRRQLHKRRPCTRAGFGGTRLPLD